MSIRLNATSALTVTETLASNVPLASDKQVTHKLTDNVQSANEASDSPVDTVVANRLTLTAGAGQLNFAALIGTNGATVNTTGKKLKRAMFKAAAANPVGVTIEPAGANGYEIFGAAGVAVLSPGQSYNINYDEAAQTVASDARLVDFTGDDDEVVDYILIFGDAAGS